MFAIAFDLVVADTAQNHPKGVSQAYAAGLQFRLASAVRPRTVA
jgi:virulence-associated protein VapD